MANKFLVEVYLPAAQRSFDMKFPSDSRIGEVNALAAALAADLSDGSYRATDQSVLVNAENGRIYDVNMKVSELGIQNGTRLILI